ARHYADAFREYGVDVEALPASEAADRLRPSGAVAAPIAAALDDWAQQTRGSGEELTRRLLTVASAIDAGPWRSRLRAAVAAMDSAALDRLAGSEETDRQPPQSLVLLATALQERRQQMAVLRRACERYPGDFWIRLDLGVLLGKSDREATFRHYDVARALRPRSPGAWNNLGNSLKDQDRLDQAVACYGKAIELHPKFA